MLVFKLFFILLPFMILFALEAIGLSFLLLIFALPFDLRLRRAFQRPSYKYVIRSLGLFLGWAALSVTWSSQGPDQQLLRLILLCVMGCLAIVSAASMTGAQKAKVQSFAVYSLIICVIGLIAVSLASQGFVMRLTGGGILQNGFNNEAPARSISILAVLVWPLVGLIFSRNSGFTGRRAILLASALVLGLAMAAFRLGVVSNLLALALGGAAFLLVALQPRVALAALSCLMLGYLLLAPTIHMDLLSGPGDQSVVAGPGTWAYRMEVWSHTARATFEAPIAGSGFEGSGFSGQNLSLGQDSTLDRQGVIDAPHNLFLRIWLELGLVGVILLGGILLGVIRAIWQRVHNGIEAGIATSVLVSFLTLSLLNMGAWHLWWIGTAWLAAIIVIVCRQSGAYDSSSQRPSSIFPSVGVMPPQITFTAKTS